MTHKCRDIEAALKKKGFLEKVDTHHKQYVYCLDGKKTRIRTFTSHSNPEYDGKIESDMRKQLHLDVHQFDNLVKCPLTKEQLEEIYREYLSTKS